MFQSSLNKGPFYAINAKAFSKSMKSRRPVICFVLACILDDAIYEPDIFPDSSIFQETRLVIIDDLLQNLFNAICD